MLTCFLFGLFVLIVIFLVPVGAKLCRTDKALKFYKYTLLSIYTGGILWLTLVNRWGMEVSRYRFKPFYVARQLLNCWFGFHKISTALCKAILKNSRHLFDSTHATPVEDLTLNIVLFMPLGFLLPYVWPKLNFYKTLLLAFILSVAIEFTQYIAQLGCCDVDDVINNLIGTCLGYCCYIIYRKISTFKK